MTNNMRAKIPPVVGEYFARYAPMHYGFLELQHPRIKQIFTPGIGWKNYPIRKRVSGNWARQMKAEGVSAVSLVAHGHTADFTIKELLRRT